MSFKTKGLKVLGQLDPLRVAAGEKQLGF